MSGFTSENGQNDDPRENIGTGGEIDFTPFQEGMYLYICALEMYL